MAYSTIDEKPKQKKIWNGPLDTIRNDTDISFLALFCTCMFVWVLVSIYAFVAGDVVEIHYTNTFKHKELIKHYYFFLQNLSASSNLIIGFITLTVSLLAGYIALFQWATKTLLWITIGLITFLLLINYVYIISYVKDTDYEQLNFPLLALNVIVIVIVKLIMYAFKKTDTEMICKVIKESCKAMFFFPSTLLFTFCQFFLHLTIAVYAAAVYEFLRVIKEPAADYDASNITASWNYNNGAIDNNSMLDREMIEEARVYSEPPVYIPVLHSINVVCFMWASSFIAGLGRTVLTAAFATWYHAKPTGNNTNASVPSAMLPKCLLRILSYHLGTVAYAASLLSIVTMIDIICRYGRDTLKKMYRRPVLLISWLIVLGKFSFDALAICAICGTGYYESAKDSYILTMKNPMSYLAVNAVSDCIIFIGLLVVPIISMISFLTYLRYSFHPLTLAVFFTSFEIIFITSVLISLTCFMVFHAASNTIRCCFLKDSKFNHEAEMKLYEIHVDDISIRENDNCSATTSK